ncbi:hypothetical protein Dimus_022013 [Dionaea muscipula]
MRRRFAGGGGSGSVSFVGDEQRTSSDKYDMVVVGVGVVAGDGGVRAEGGCEGLHCWDSPWRSERSCHGRRCRQCCGIPSAVVMEQ